MTRRAKLGRVGAVLLAVGGFLVVLSGAAWADTTGLSSNTRSSCFVAAADGSATWSPQGPGDRDVLLSVQVALSGATCGSNGMLASGSWDGGRPALTWEPDSYVGDGSGSVYTNTTTNGSVSWVAGEVVVVRVSDYGPCTNSSCPETQADYELPSGWGGLPTYATDGTGSLSSFAVTDNTQAGFTSGGSTTTTTAGSSCVVTAADPTCGSAEMVLASSESWVAGHGAELVAGLIFVGVAFVLLFRYLRRGTAHA